MVLAQVEDFLFKVPKDILEQSEAFQDLFGVPLLENVAVGGSDDDHPLHLDGCVAEDFRQLLRVVLPM